MEVIEVGLEGLLGFCVDGSNPVATTNGLWVALVW